MNDHDKAIKYFEESIKEDPNWDIYEELANCYFHKEDYEKSIYYYNLSLELNPENPECNYNLGNIYCV